MPPKQGQILDLRLKITERNGKMGTVAERQQLFLRATSL